MFAELERRIAEKTEAGIDVISLGIGDPDRPTYPHIVEAMREAVADPGTHQYPSNRGRAEFREAFASFYDTRFGVAIDAGERGDPGDRRQGVHLQPLLRLPRPRGRRPRRGSGLPRLHGRAAPRRRRGRADAAGPRARLRSRPRRDRRVRARERAADVPELPEQPDRRRRPRRLLRARRRARPQARHPRRPRQRLLGDHLRRLRRAELPGDAGGQGGRRRGLLALQGLQHDRLALRGDPGERRRDQLLLAPQDEHRLGALRGGPARRRGRPRRARATRSRR